MEGGGGQHLRRAHGCLGPWLVPGRSTGKQSEFDDFIHSFVCSFIIQQNRHFCILLLCLRYCAGFGDLGQEKSESLYLRRDDSLVQKSGISQRIRVRIRITMCKSPCCDSMGPEDLPWPRVRGGFVKAETCGLAGSNITKK